MSSSACNLISIETRRLQNLQTHYSLIQLTKQPLSQLSSTRDLPRLSKCTSIYSNCAYHVTTTTNMPSDQSQFIVVQQQPSLAEEEQTSTTPMIVTTTTTTTTPTSPATTSATSTVGTTTITTNEEKMFQLIEQLSDHHEKSQMYSNRNNNYTNNNNDDDDDDDDSNDNKDHDDDMELKKKKKKRQTFRMVSVSDYSAMSHALLHDFGGEESMVIRILKSMQQSTIMHVLVLVKALLQKPHKILTKDVQGSWNISIYFPTMNHSMTSSGSRNLSLETTGHPQKICVCHRRREQVYEKVVNNSEDGDGGRKTTFRNLFQFEWQICFFLDEWSNSSSSGGGSGGGVFDVFVQLMNTDIGTDETRDVSAQKQAVHSVFSEINDLEYESTLQSLKEENNGENQSSSADQNNGCEGGHVNKQQVKQPLLDEEAQKKNQQTQQHQHQSRTHLHPHFSLESTKNRISKSISKLSLFSCSEKLDENEDQRPQKSPKSPRR